MGLFSIFKNITNEQNALDETYLHSAEFEYRLIRARSDNLKILDYLDEEKKSACIYNADSKNEYTVSLKECECDDFKKHKRLCKHMIFLMIKTNRYKMLEVKTHSSPKSCDHFIPLYWDYYDGLSTGLGYMNLYTYEVVGRKLGVSEKTGKPTNRKAKIIVNAVGSEDALEAAKEKGVVAPYESCECLDLSPSYEQYKYLNGARIPHPNLLTSIDLSALLTRYEDNDDSKPSVGLFAIATKYRVSVSYFCSVGWIVSNIWSALDDSDKISFYCYAVYCQEKHYSIGTTSIAHDEKIFKSFCMQNKEKEYVLSLNEFGYHIINKKTSAYRKATEYLKANKLL